MFALASMALAEPPLLVEGKKTIYQRVIVHPGAYRYSQPDSSRGEYIDPFTVFYIYKRESVNGNNWLLCAPNTVGRDKIWVMEDRTSQWNRAMVLLLAGATERKPLLFFKDKQALEKVATSEPLGQTVLTIEKQIREYERTGASPPPDFPVVAVEPEFKKGTVRTDTESFYLMPIFNYDDRTFDNLLLLEVASVRPADDEANGTAWLDFGRKVMTGSYQRPKVSSWASKAEGTSLIAGKAAAKVKAHLPKASLDRPILLASNGDKLPWAPAAGAADPFPTFDSPTLVAQNVHRAWSDDAYHLYIAFVIDTTISMEPYIEQTLDISREMYERIVSQGLEKNVSLAVVAFRSSVAASPGIEYTTRIVTNFKNASEGSSFLSAVDRVHEAKFSTHSFNEDSFAGLESAIYDLDWPENNTDGKIIILISDAGPLPAWDPYRSTEHSPSSLAGLAKSKKITLIPIHVKSRAGRRTHATAEDAYRYMSSAANREGDAYIDIDAGGSTTWTSDTFGTVADSIMRNLEAQLIKLGEADTSSQFSDEPSINPFTSGQDNSQSPPFSGGGIPRLPDNSGGLSSAEDFVNQVAPYYPPDNLNNQTAQGTLDTQQPPDTGQQTQVADIPQNITAPKLRGTLDLDESLTDKPIISPRPNSDDPSVQRAAEIGQRIGLSIRLNYLGVVNDVKAPQIVKSWIADKDLIALAGESKAAREVPTVEVAVLLTKNQLSSLRGQLRTIMEQADKSLESQSRDFFQSILSASARIANDPQAFSLKPETKLGDLGVMGEFLEDLPYKSVIMGKTEQDWYNMSYVEQDNFIRVIQSKVDLYEQYDQDVKNWAKFDLEDSGDWLSRVPLPPLPSKSRVIKWLFLPVF
jgi:hypothetical protein